MYRLHSIFEEGRVRDILHSLVDKNRANVFNIYTLNDNNTVNYQPQMLLHQVVKANCQFYFLLNYNR
jgi:hypothetical protein